jgi:hypothetical protein
VTVFVIDLNDRALSLCSDGRVLASAPAAVTPAEEGGLAGASAWSRLRREPKSIATRHWWELAHRHPPSARSTALIGAELAARLQEHPPVAGSRIWMATPAMLEPAALGILLGIVRALGLSLEGFVDAAVASAAALGLDRPALALELGLHHVAVAALEGAAPIRKRRVVSSERGGLLELYQHWLALVGAMFVKRTRFDPFHDAATEQQLFDLLPTLARAAARAGNATAVLEARGARLEVPISSDQLTQAAEPVYREMLALMRSLRPAGAPIALLVPQAVVELPGMRAALAQFFGCELVALADGFGGAAASLLDLPRSELDHGAVPLLRRLPAQRQESCASLAQRELLERDARQSLPTHVLLAGRTFALGRSPIAVGRALGEPDAISLPEGLAGVSRRHCTLLREGDATVLVDHSRCGTYVNGERVLERARVHAGDRIRIGEPGVELALIAVSSREGDRYAPPPH